MSDDDRRSFLKVAACGLGGLVGAATAAPALSLVIKPSRQQTVTTPKEPIDIADVTAARGWDRWTKVDVIAPELRDGWTTARNVVLGAAYVRFKSDFEAVSGVCPHLGCAVGFEGNSFLCPCHDSRFGLDGARQTGPAPRGLDPLPIEVKDGRLRLTWVRYKLDVPGREPA